MRFQRVLMPQWDVPSGTERPIIGKGFMWGWGVVFPAVLVLYGLGCILSQEAAIPGFRCVVMLYGMSAIVAGMATIAAAALVHLLCFWDAVSESNRARARAKLLCLCVIGASAYFMCYQTVRAACGLP